MKEVDFLPQWYRESRRRQSSVQRQYLVLGVLFLIMVMWNAMATRSISLATADLAGAEPQRIVAERICYQYDELLRQVTHRRQGLRLLQDLEGGFDLASVLAELSALIDGPVVLESLEVMTERTSPSSPSRPPSVAETPDVTASAERPVRFQVVMKGLALDATTVAVILKAMETSAYFRQVTLVISRNIESHADRMNVPGSKGTAPLSLVFEIRCFLATEGVPHPNR